MRWSWPSAAAAREESEEHATRTSSPRRSALSQDRHVALLDDIDDLMRSLNTAQDGGLTYDAEYALVVARKAG